MGLGLGLCLGLWPYLWKPTKAITSPMGSGVRVRVIFRVRVRVRVSVSYSFFDANVGFRVRITYRCFVTETSVPWVIVRGGIGHASIIHCD